MTKAQFIDRYGEEAYKRHLEQRKQYRENHKEEIAEKQKQYYQDNKDKFAEYYQRNKEEIAEQRKQYLQTPICRANNLISGYKRKDKLYNRGDCTLTSDWVVNNIFNSKCIYCGETDWKLLGCDRIDNSLAHTEDNVVCCCGKCNREKHFMSVQEFLEKKSVKS